ncbi:MAG: molybdenum cofactor guanylyltransferase [Anaerolineae bacterium]
MPDVSAIVLAGGKSSRFGQDKAFLEFGGEALIARVISRLAQIGREVIIVTNAMEKFSSMKANLVKDFYPGRGSLGGIYSGLRAARYPYGLVVACDMPFLNPELLRYLVSLASGYDVVIPRLAGLPEPLHAVYSKNCLPPIDRLLASGGRKIIDFFPEVRVRYVEDEEIARFDPQKLSFFNINIPEDLEEARKLVEG